MSSNEIWVILLKMNAEDLLDGSAWDISLLSETVIYNATNAVEYVNSSQEERQNGRGFCWSPLGLAWDREEALEKSIKLRELMARNRKCSDFSREKVLISKG
jgi:hypothetical protein